MVAAEPDEDLRAELQALLDGPADELLARFSGHLTFGTAGLRAAVGAGPLRMNRLVGRQAAAGLAAYVAATDDRAGERGIVIGYDLRRKSDVIALDTARVVAGAGLPARLLPAPLPTPVLAWALLDLDAGAGVMVTASHNPPQDNGYKVYLGDGPQIVSPRDVEIAPRIAEFDPPSVSLAAEDDPRIDRLDHAVVDRYVASIARRAAASGRPRCDGGVHADARRGGGDVAAGVRDGGAARAGRRRDAVPPRSGVPDRGVPEPGGAGSDGSRHRARP